MNTNSEKIKEQISAYLDGELSQEETSQVEDLILNNKEWQQYYKELQGLQNVLTTWEDEAISPDLASKVQKSLLGQKLKEEYKMKKPSFTKQVAPVLTVAVCVIVGLLSMQVYIKRGTQGRLKQASDDIGGRFSTSDKRMDGAYKPYARAFNDSLATGTDGDMQNMSRRLQKSARVRDAGKYLAEKTDAVGSAKEYQPYYLATDYEVDRKAIQSQHIQSKTADTFRAGVTQSRLGADESTKANLYSQVTSVEQEYWGSAPQKLAAVSREKGGFQQSTYDMAASAPVKHEEQIPYMNLDDPNRPHPGEAGFNTENYERIYENEFLTVSENPLSTFSIDVDTASYANLRRFLNNGNLPPKDSVRIEEMVNYFSYNYPQPRKSDPFSVTLKASTAPWNPNHNLVLVGLQGQTLAPNEIPPSNLVFLIDVSGSMNSANKLPLLKDAFKMMVNQLSAKERVAIVVYAGAAGEVLPSTSGANKQAILAAIDRLSAGGSTAGGAGIQLAYNIAKKNFIKGGNNRVILATDGDFNVGVSNNGDLIRMIEEKRNDGIFLTTLGFGTGNYKDSRMEQIANKGNGNHYYIDTRNEAQKVLVRELGSTLFAIAKDVKLQIEFNPAQVKAYRLIGYENRMLAKEDFNDDTKDAGELGAGHTVTALYEIVPADSAETFGVVDQLKYQAQQVISSKELLTVKLRYKKPDENTSKLLQESIKMNEITTHTDADFQFASSVAEFGLLLRNSKFKAQASFANILKRANQAKGSDPYGYRAEFISLVEKAKGLMPNEGIYFKDTDPQPAHGGGMFFKGGQDR